MSAACGFCPCFNPNDLQSWGPGRVPVVSNGQVGPDGGQFYHVAKGMKQFTFILLTGGGHRVSVYTPYIEQSLQWLGPVRAVIAAGSHDRVWDGSLSW